MVVDFFAEDRYYLFPELARDLVSWRFYAVICLACRLSLRGFDSPYLFLITPDQSKLAGHLFYVKSYLTGSCQSRPTLNYELMAEPN